MSTGLVFSGDLLLVSHVLLLLRVKSVGFRDEDQGNATVRDGTGDEALTIKAAVALSDPKDLSEVAAWFETEWKKGETLDSVKIEALRWLKRRRNRSLDTHEETLLRCLRKYPSAVQHRPIRVIVYNDEEPSEEAKVFTHFGDHRVLNISKGRFRSVDEMDA